MIAVIVLLLFAGIVVAFIGGLVWLVRHYSRAQREAWQQAATQLGLHYDGRQIVGTRHGQRVRVCTVTRGSGDSRTTYTVVSSQLPMALDLGFKLRKHGFLNNMFHASEDHVVGDPRFDEAFIVSADEPHRVRSLLGPKLRGLLVQQLGTSSSFDVSDHGATIETTGVSSSMPWLTWAVESATRICSGLELARHSVPVATPLAPHRHAWRNFALANGMDLIKADDATRLLTWYRDGRERGIEITPDAEGPGLTLTAFGRLTVRASEEGVSPGMLVMSHVWF